MINMCDSCKHHWDGDDKGNLSCICTQFAAAFAPITGKGVEACKSYKCAAIIETDDDGTQRCSVCGALWTGWKVCPSCGADMRTAAERQAELTRVTTVEVTEIVRGTTADVERCMTADSRDNSAYWLACYIKKALGLDDVKAVKVQDFYKEEQK